MDGNAMVGRCGRLVTAMTRCECVEVTFDELIRRMREQRARLDAVQAETGVGLLCTACLPDLREHLGASGIDVPAPTGSSCVPDETLDADEPEPASDAPAFAAIHDPR